MKRFFLVVPVLVLAFSATAQFRIKNKKYPSLLWEITGNGLKKPSYLFGTMHVSSKLAFHLSDSFYLAIRNADVVALETNPESWQEDITKYDLADDEYNRYADGWGFNFNQTADGYLTIHSLRFVRYEKMLEQTLFSRPSVINNLLYRSSTEQSSDFEEDTYLDMYIYQTGKKLGKKVTGVEDYAESMRLMLEAYRDASKDKKQKEKSYEDDAEFSPSRLQEAYRTGNLDLLDTINRLNSYSDAFDEKFLFQRNEIQAKSIDSILKKSSLFAGVGAAHLPGLRGVIEILRAKGYTLRPVIMGTRDSRHKEQVEKLKVPVVFSTQTSDDGFYKVDIPGKFYWFSENPLLDQQQYADMANGSYYMVTRIRTNAFLWGHSTDVVARKIDSLLYENVPGKILNKKMITRNGYKGFDITNRTRRGDHQRYHIFITPAEVLFFKISGTGDYITKGNEAEKFFSSIQLRESKTSGWKKFQPAYGGFSADFPHEPQESFDGNWHYDAEDKTTGSFYTIIRTDVHNYGFAEEDTFDLSLMEESFASSEFVDKLLSRTQTVHKGYPALDCRYRHRDGSWIFVKYLIRGPHYYTLVARSKNEHPDIDRFLNSFEIAPFLYGELKTRTDTTMNFSVKTPWFPQPKKEKIQLNDDFDADEDDNDFASLAGDGNFKSKLYANDTTGEKILVSFFRSPRYFYNEDTTSVDERFTRFNTGADSTWITRSRSVKVLPGDLKVYEIVLSDTNSSRAIWTKTFYRRGAGFVLMTQVDTLSAPGSFIKNFFETFTPADSIQGNDPFEKKSALWFADLFSSDSITRKKALAAVNYVQLDSADFEKLAQVIQSFDWSDKKYLDNKKNFISKLSYVGTNQSADYLEGLYVAAGDTAQLQYTILEALLKHRTIYAYKIFSDIMTNDPPVMDAGSNYTFFTPLSIFGRGQRKHFSNGNFFDELYDSLPLTRTVIHDLLPLMNLDDYKWPVMRLLSTLVDSNLVKKEDYNIYFSKFLLETRQELKKQRIDEMKKAIEKAQDEKKTFSFYDSGKDKGNEDLSVYASLLLPFWDTHPGVALLFQQLLSSNDLRLKYNILLLMLHHNRPVPDPLFKFFANTVEYLYELYSDLKKMKQFEKFPQRNNNHLDLARSKLMNSKTYGLPDSVLYADRMETVHRNRKGYIYFFKYKQKKDDAGWKIATVGLVPPDPVKFEFDEEDHAVQNGTAILPGGDHDSYDFTEFTEVRIKSDEPLRDQLQKQLKKMIYSKRKSAKNFYGDADNPYSYDVTAWDND